MEILSYLGGGERRSVKVEFLERKREIVEKGIFGHESRFGNSENEVSFSKITRSTQTSTSCLRKIREGQRMAQTRTSVSVGIKIIVGGV